MRRLITKRAVGERVCFGALNGSLSMSVFCIQRTVCLLSTVCLPMRERARALRERERERETARARALVDDLKLRCVGAVKERNRREKMMITM